MPHLLSWILSIYGVAFLLADAKILDTWIPIRPLLRRCKFLSELLDCYFCVGLWLSLIGWVVFNYPYVLTLSAAKALLYVPAGAAGAYLLHLLAEFIGARTELAETKTVALMTSLTGGKLHGEGRSNTPGGEVS